MRKALAVSLLLLLLGGCDQAPQKQDAPPVPLAANTEFGRWMIMPAASVPDTANGDKYWSVWRLDTKTGDLDFCTYDDQATVTVATLRPPLECSNRISGNASDQ